MRLRTAPVGDYVPGTSALHRAHPGWKVLGLAALSTAVVVWRSPTTTAIALLAVLGLWLLARVPLRLALRALRLLAPVLVVFGAVQWWQHGWRSAVAVLGSILASVSAAGLLTVTTRVDDMVGLVLRLAAPLRHVGLPPERLALAIALTMRMIPQFQEIAAQTRDAARARGLERDRRALVVPLAIRATRRMHATGEALAARGLGD